ncbi:MAG: ABC transporter substrate-binding protein [Candidatus Kariarchaeaceae archaeon]
MLRRFFRRKEAKLIIILAILLAGQKLQSTSAKEPFVTLELQVPQNQQLREYASLIKFMLKDIGIEVRIKEGPTMRGEVPDYQLNLLTYKLSNNPYIYPYFTVGNNYNSWYDDEYNEELLKAGLATSDPAEKKIIYNLWQEHVMDQLPYLPLTSPLEYYAIKETIQNYHPNYGFYYPAISREDGGETLTLAEESFPENFNPLNYGDDSSEKAIASVLQGLYTLNYLGEIVPQLASAEPIISENQLTWTISLREDIFWQDGEKFTAEDVYFSVMAYTSLYFW